MHRTTHHLPHEYVLAPMLYSSTAMLNCSSLPQQVQVQVLGVQIQGLAFPNPSPSPMT